MCYAVYAGEGDPRENQVRFLEEFNEKHRTQGSEPEDMAAIAADLRGHEAYVLIENSTKTYETYWVLMNLGVRVVVAQAQDLYRITMSVKKTDKNDSVELAAYMRRYLAGEREFAVCTMPPFEWMMRREVCRVLFAEKRHLGDLKRRVKSHLLLHGIRLSREYRDIFSKKAVAELKATKDPCLLIMVSEAAAIKSRTAEEGQLISQMFGGNRMYGLIMSIPGFGMVSAAYLMSMVMDIDRFPSRKAFAAYFGVVPKMRESADTTHNCATTHRGDAEVRRRVNAIKQDNKHRFAAFTARNDGVTLNTDAIMDVQVKRLHEYKRQLLCAMSIARLQMELHDDPNRDFLPRTFVFGAKAAAGYKTAKRIIELLLSMAADINNDPVCKDKLQVCFVENYRVSAAEAIIPAAQVSEQISTAGKEASGTGCMKLMMNGAVTIGTLDGANVEMFERLGKENMFLFGLHADEVERLRASGYDPAGMAARDGEIMRIMERFRQGFADGKSYSDLVSGLLYGGDPYMLIADYRAYADCQRQLYERIADSEERARLAIVNTAESGIFAADRAIEEYAKNIWGVR